MPDEPHTTEARTTAAPDPDLRVLVDATSARVGGGLTFVVEQLAALAARPGVTGELVASPANAAVLAERVGWPARAIATAQPGLRYLWEQTGLRRRSRPFDVVYCPANLGPLTALPVPLVVALQDANYVMPASWRAANLGRAKRAKRALCVRTARLADEVVVISASLQDLVERSLPELAGRTTVVPSAAPTWPDRPASPPVALPERYLVVVANDSVHKRLDLVVRAWARGAGRQGVGLVVCGALRPGRDAVLRASAGPASAPLVLLGAVADRAVLAGVVAGALASVSASVLESYPLTPSEAGALATPLVLADIPAHREVAGGHAIYVPVDDTDAWARALSEVASSPPERVVWRPPQTWATNAAALEAVLRRAASRRPGSSAGGGAGR
jgi:glycosyltransferase involved in cell wall biosynthesis